MFRRPNYRHVSLIEFFEMYCQNINDDKAKLAFLFSNIQAQFLNIYCKNSTVRKMKFEHAKKFVLSLMLITNDNDILSQLINDVEGIYFEAGLMTHLLREGIRRFWKEKFIDEEDNRKVLTLTDLEHGFVLWIIACGISLTAFIIELCFSQLARNFRKFIGLNYFVRLLRMRVRNYQN